MCIFFFWYLHFILTLFQAIHCRPSISVKHKLGVRVQEVSNSTTCYYHDVTTILSFVLFLFGFFFFFVHFSESDITGVESVWAWRGMGSNQGICLSNEVLFASSNLVTVISVSRNHIQVIFCVMC